MTARPTPLDRSSASSRRRFLRHLALAGAGVAVPRAWADTLAASALAPATSATPFRFLVVNDLHHASAACDGFLEALVAAMRPHLPAACCLLVGDLADKGAPESLVAVRDAFAPLGIPLRPVPGNHDCDQGENTAHYAAVFPDCLNHHFSHGGWQFVGLDSTDGNKWGDTRVGADALAFLDRVLPTRDPRAPTVLFTHFPLAADVPMASLNAADVLRRFDGLRLVATFSGHYHARTERRAGATTLLTNTCCSRTRGPHDGSTSEGFLVCTAHPDGTLERDYVEFAPAMLAG